MLIKKLLNLFAISTDWVRMFPPESIALTPFSLFFDLHIISDIFFHIFLMSDLCLLNSPLWYSILASRMVFFSILE